MKKLYISALVLAGSAMTALGQVVPVADPTTLLSDTKTVADTALMAGLALSVAVIGWRLIKRFIRV